MSQRAVENREKNINRENWLQNHLWCPNDPRGEGIDDDDDDDDDSSLEIYIRIRFGSPVSSVMDLVSCLCLPLFIRLDQLPIYDF